MCVHICMYVCREKRYKRCVDKQHTLKPVEGTCVPRTGRWRSAAKVQREKLSLVLFLEFKDILEKRRENAPLSVSQPVCIHASQLLSR